MIVFQFDTEGESFLVVILEPGQLDRMKNADPVTLNPTDVGGVIQPISNPLSLHLLVAYEQDGAKLREIMDNAPSQHDAQVRLFQHVMRGYQSTRKDGPEALAREKARAAARRSAKRN